MSEENKNYDEYDATPLTMEEAIVEAKRCLNCKKPGCITGCPISNDIPDFIHQLSRGNFGEPEQFLPARLTFLPYVVEFALTKNNARVIVYLTELANQSELVN